MALRVLVVDDSPVTRVMLLEMLDLLGHKAVAEADAMDTAVEAYKNQKPDLVLLDLALTRGDGLSTLKGIRRIDGQARVLIISGNPQQKIQEEAMNSGALGFLSKPINMKELSAALTRIGTEPR
ncbi:MAG: response regulator [Elusimicrobia bacterium]|nr:response regulator [Elusimicrobiota bacterium]